MNTYVITTDSNADLPKDLIAHYQIPIIPQYYEINEVIYGDEKKLTPSEFYAKMRDGAMPKSMANNPAVIHDTFEAILKQKKDILHIAFSSALSGSYSNVCMVAQELQEEYPESKIIVVDSLNVSLGEALVVLHAFQLQAQGATIEANEAALNECKTHINVAFTVNDLHHLQRGGRISKGSAIIGSMINIKPLLCINKEGKLVANGTVRGRKKSLNALIKTMQETLENESSVGLPVGIVHGDCIDDANYIKDTLKETLNIRDVIINDINPSIGTHAGPGAIGICYYGKVLEK